MRVRERSYDSGDDATQAMQPNREGCGPSERAPPLACMASTIGGLSTKPSGFKAGVSENGAVCPGTVIRVRVVCGEREGSFTVRTDGAAGPTMRGLTATGATGPAMENERWKMSESKKAIEKSRKMSDLRNLGKNDGGGVDARSSFRRTGFEKSEDFIKR